jgi:hypothetical protein
MVLVILALAMVILLLPAVTQCWVAAELVAEAEVQALMEAMAEVAVAPSEVSAQQAVEMAETEL